MTNIAISAETCPKNATLLYPKIRLKKLKAQVRHMRPQHCRWNVKRLARLRTAYGGQYARVNAVKLVTLVTCMSLWELSAKMDSALHLRFARKSSPSSQSQVSDADVSVLTQPHSAPAGHICMQATQEQEEDFLPSIHGRKRCCLPPLSYNVSICSLSLLHTHEYTQCPNSFRKKLWAPRL